MIFFFSNAFSNKSESKTIKLNSNAIHETTEKSLLSIGIKTPLRILRDPLLEAYWNKLNSFIQDELIFHFHINPIEN